MTATALPVLDRRYDGDILGRATTARGAQRVAVAAWSRRGAAITARPHVRVGFATTADGQSIEAWIPESEIDA